MTSKGNAVSNFFQDFYNKSPGPNERVKVRNFCVTLNFTGPHSYLSESDPLLNVSQIGIDCTHGLYRNCTKEIICKAYAIPLHTQAQKSYENHSTIEHFSMGLNRESYLAPTNTRLVLSLPLCFPWYSVLFSCSELALLVGEREANRCKGCSFTLLWSLPYIESY